MKILKFLLGYFENTLKYYHKYKTLIFFKKQTTHTGIFSVMLHTYDKNFINGNYCRFFFLGSNKAFSIKNYDDYKSHMILNATKISQCIMLCVKSFFEKHTEIIIWWSHYNLIKFEILTHFNDFTVQKSEVADVSHKKIIYLIWCE